MPDNPTKYREHVKRCLVLAGEASSPLANAQLEYLAQTWMDLADVIDRIGSSAKADDGAEECHLGKRRLVTWQRQAL